MKVDAALYWTSYAQAKMNRTAASLANLARLQKDFPTSRWTKEGKALEREVRGKAGQAPRPDQEDDADLKLMAVSAMAQTDPKEALPVLAKILASPASSRKVKERSLFVLAQMGSDQAGNAIAEVARGNSSPELQRKAIQYLGVFGGPANRKVLSEVYGSTTDNALRKQILNSFMVSGDKARVLEAAKTEKEPALRSAAIRLLGVMHGTTELGQMYTTATTAEEKKDILQALFVGGAIEPVAAAAKGEKDKDVRLAAVRNLGLMGRGSETVLAEMYRVETDPEVKKEVLNAFFLQGNSGRLVEIARVEKDPTLKKEAVHWLSLMNSKEARAYMLELLKD
jgi:HEAT repeat protein